MKRIFFAGTLILAFFSAEVSAVVVSAGLSPGITVDYQSSRVEIMGVSGSAYQSRNIFGIEAFLDVHYLLLGISYDTMTGGMTSGAEVMGIPGEPLNDPGFGGSRLRFDFFFKFPYSPSDKLALFPLLGVKYSVNLTSTYAGLDLKEFMTDEAIADMNDLYAVIGFGGDLAFGKYVFLRLSAAVSYNLTLAPRGMAAKNFFGFDFGTAVAIGFKFNP